MRKLTAAVMALLVTTALAAATPTLAEGGPVDINKATVAELTSIKGIGPAKAQAIIDYHEAHGSFESVDDLKAGKGKVAVKLATTGHTYAMENLPGVPLTVLDTAALCVVEVVQGKAEAFIYDQISIYNHWKEHEETTRPILEPIRSETWGIGVRKGNAELLAQVNAFLKEFREKGGFTDLAERYMAAEKAAFDEMGVPFIFH